MEQALRVIETRNVGYSRIQIAEHSPMGWIVTVFLADHDLPVRLQSDDPSSLPKLVERAKLWVEEHEALTVSPGVI